MVLLVIIPTLHIFQKDTVINLVYVVKQLSNDHGKTDVFNCFLSFVVVLLLFFCYCCVFILDRICSIEEAV